VDAEERELVTDLRRGNAAAFRRAYAAYRPRVYGFLLRLSGRRDVADDLLQETFIKLARNAASLREDTRLVAWLLTVARNEFLSYRRWSVLDITRILSFGREQSDAVDEGPEARTQAQARLQLLERGLSELPTASREVLLLVGVEGLDQEEAAEILGLGYAALRQRLSRARAELAQRIEALEKRRAKLEPKRASERGAT